MARPKLSDFITTTVRASPNCRTKWRNRIKYDNYHCWCNLFKTDLYFFLILFTIKWLIKVFIEVTRIEYCANVWCAQKRTTKLTAWSYCRGRECDIALSQTSRWNNGPTEWRRQLAQLRRQKGCGMNEMLICQGTRHTTARTPSIGGRLNTAATTASLIRLTPFGRLIETRFGIFTARRTHNTYVVCVKKAR